jgi:hypothetical protein
VLWPYLLLSCTEFSQCILDVLCHVGLKHRARVHRLGHRHFPCPQQAFHVLARVLIHDEVCVHEGSVKIATDIDGIRSTDVLDNGIKDIKGWKLPFGASLYHVSHQWTK